MGLCISLIVIGLTIGFLAFGYVGLLIGLFTALLTSWIANQILYKKSVKNPSSPNT